MTTRQRPTWLGWLRHRALKPTVRHNDAARRSRGSWQHAVAYRRHDAVSAFNARGYDPGSIGIAAIAVLKELTLGTTFARRPVGRIGGLSHPAVR